MITEDKQQLIIAEINELYQRAGGAAPIVLFADGPIDALLLRHILSYIQEEDPIFSIKVIYEMIQKWRRIWDNPVCRFDDFGHMCGCIGWSHKQLGFRTKASQMKDIAIKRWTELVEKEIYKTLILSMNIDKLCTNIPLYAFLAKGIVQPDLQDSLDDPFEYTVLDDLLQSYYDYEGEVDNIKTPLTTHIYTISILKDYCIVCQKPVEERKNGHGRYHCVTSSAVKFADGYEEYFLHGEEVEKEWIINPKSITFKNILSQEGNYRKDELIRHIGGNKFADFFDLALMDSDKYNGQKISLYRTIDKIEQVEDYIYFVKVICNSTQREYNLCVPPEAASSAINALAWTFDMTPETYLLDVET